MPTVAGAGAGRVVSVNNERHARDEQLLKLSRHDPLTGELNRTLSAASVAEAIEECARFRLSSAFMLIGIDHLARVNDAFGFDADAVIAEVGKRIRAMGCAAATCSGDFPATNLPDPAQTARSTTSTSRPNASSPLSATRWCPPNPAPCR